MTDTARLEPIQEDPGHSAARMLDGSTARAPAAGDTLMSTTKTAWGLQSAAQARCAPDPQDVDYAAASVRDEFLGVLDAGNRPEARRIAMHLTHCRNDLPGTTCVELGLPPGSSYGAAARRLLRD